MRTIRKAGLVAGILVGASLLLGSLGANAQKKKSETIQANVWGQLRASGKIFNMTIIIDSYSNEDDQQTLINAFNRGGQERLVSTLENMKSRGRVAITGTVGNSIAYVRSFPTENGRRIRIITNRPLNFPEAYYHGRSTSYNVTLIEMNINRLDPSKSTGSLIIGARIRVNKNTGQIEVESYGSGPWRMTNIKEWD
jgi:hypothetical protein